MRPVCAILAAIFCASPLVLAAPAVTLALQFDAPYSAQSLYAMEQEVASIVGESGIKVDWKLLSDIHPTDVLESLIMVRFRGTCILQPAPYRADPHGSYAFTHVSEGRVLPFSEVECDKIRSSIGPVMSSEQWQQRDLIFGRALGRVLAHELFHVLAKTQHHTAEGVTKSALTAAQLIDGRLTLTRTDLAELQR